MATAIFSSEQASAVALRVRAVFRTRSPRPAPWVFLLLWALSSALGSLVASQLVWNFTPSLPYGLYWRRPDAHVERGDLVALRVPRTVRGLVHDRAYLPEGSFLLKPVAAVAPDLVCVRDGVLFINDAPFGPLLPRDQEGRDLPQYAGCLALADGQVFLASPHPWSFDSRTFGIVDVHALQGTVTPLWTY